MTKKIEPLPCPFCGSSASVYVWEPSVYWTIRCDNFKCIGNAIQMNRWKTKEQAIELWNQRK